MWWDKCRGRSFSAYPGIDLMKLLFSSIRAAGSSRDSVKRLQSTCAEALEQRGDAHCTFYRLQGRCIFETHSHVWRHTLASGDRPRHALLSVSLRWAVIKRRPSEPEVSSGLQKKSEAFPSVQTQPVSAWLCPWDASATKETSGGICAHWNKYVLRTDSWLFSRASLM